MHDIFALLAKHGYSFLFGLVLMEALGLPVPAAVALMTAGALSAKGLLRPELAFGTAVSALLLGDITLFTLGRYTGWWLLSVLCRLSTNPEGCILRSANTFYKRGRLTLLFAKFVPGINSMAPPLSGSMGMRLRQFLALDLMGASLYTTVYGGLGFLFSGVIATVIVTLQRAGRVVEYVAVALVVLYVVRQVVLYQKERVYKLVPRVEAEEVAARMASEDDNIFVADVRSHGYYQADASRIKGSTRIEPNALPLSMVNFPRDHEIYLYCTCIRETTSARVAHLLRQNGFQASVISGGLHAWQKAGHPLETVPPEDVVLLPKFI